MNYRKLLIWKIRRSTPPPPLPTVLHYLTNLETFFNTNHEWRMLHRTEYELTNNRTRTILHTMYQDSIEELKNCIYIYKRITHLTFKKTQIHSYTEYWTRWLSIEVLLHYIVGMKISYSRYKNCHPMQMIPVRIADDKRYIHIVCKLTSHSRQHRTDNGFQ